MKYKYIIASLLIGFCGVVSAQEELLSKDAAVTLALENNFGIKVAKNQVAIADNNAGILNSG
ncbi:MAG: TolC family protein, partial [Arenibacter sp.]